jgi:hypothetical protein
MVHHDKDLNAPGAQPLIYRKSVGMVETESAAWVFGEGGTLFALNLRESEKGSGP